MSFELAGREGGETMEGRTDEEDVRANFSTRRVHTLLNSLREKVSSDHDVGSERD